MKPISTVQLPTIELLQNWLKEQCDGDWEHSFGLSIETIDNPGWHVEIDLAETSLSGVEMKFLRAERSDVDWVQFEIREGKFIGSGGVCNLDEILRRFLALTGAEGKP